MKSLLLKAALLAACSYAGITAGATGTTHECSRIVEDAARLACYDQAFGKAAPEPAAAPVSAPAPTPTPTPATVAVAAAAATPASAPAKPAVAPTEDFGFKPAEVERKKEVVEVKPEEPNSISARVTAVETRQDKFIATLDNGQVWSQIELDTRVRLAAGDTVTLRRAIFGSYLLIGPQGVATRVKRRE